MPAGPASQSPMPKCFRNAWRWRGSGIDSASSRKNSARVRAVADARPTRILAIGPTSSQSRSAACACVDGSITPPPGDVPSETLTPGCVLCGATVRGASRAARTAPFGAPPRSESADGIPGEPEPPTSPTHPQSFLQTRARAGPLPAPWVRRPQQKLPPAVRRN